MATSHKCTEPAKTTLPSYMKEELEEIARKAGCDFSDVLRDIVYLARRSVTFGEHVANDRRAALSGKGDSLGEMGVSK